MMESTRATNLNHESRDEMSDLSGVKPASFSKHRSRQKLREAVRSGVIKKPCECSICGKAYALPFIQGHHHNGHDRWWDVQWVCRQCHYNIDKEKMRQFGETNGMSKHPEKSNFSKNNPSRKLSTEDVLKIRQMLKDGMFTRRIASIFGVTHQNIWAIQKRKTWRRL